MADNPQILLHRWYQDDAFGTARIGVVFVPGAIVRGRPGGVWVETGAYSDMAGVMVTPGEAVHLLRGALVSLAAALDIPQPMIAACDTPIRDVLSVMRSRVEAAELAGRQRATAGGGL